MLLAVERHRNRRRQVAEHRSVARVHELRVDEGLLRRGGALVAQVEVWRTDDVGGGAWPGDRDVQGVRRLAGEDQAAASLAGDDGQRTRARTVQLTGRSERIGLARAQLTIVGDPGELRPGVGRHRPPPLALALPLLAFLL